MNNRARHLSRQYRSTLGRYLARQQEELLQQAYEIGRAAITDGLGVLDMARIHQRALLTSLRPAIAANTRARALNAAETFFMEALSPFEAAHRAFRDANSRLQQLNATLETRNAELKNEVAQRERTEAALRNLSSKILHVQEDERKRISRELHDEVGGSLAGINVNLAVLQKGGAFHDREAQKKFADTQRLLQQTMEAVHDFARELRPAALDDLGLVPALRSYLKAFAERAGVRVNFEATAAAEDLTGEQKTVVFRVAQESLTNVAKHAHAHRVDVTLRKQNGELRVQIRDDGKSFCVDQQLASNGRQRLGLLGMQERVRLVNGRFAVKSTPGAGTTVELEIPFKTAGPMNGKLFQRG